MTGTPRALVARAKRAVVKIGSRTLAGDAGAVAWDGREPHVHSHVHASLRHTHPHYPDVHHRHGH